jgi:transcriptional regulator with XRE-family HTH domain
MIDIATELRAIRTIHRKTLAELSVMTGLSKSYLSDLEHGRSRPSIDTLEKIARAYGMVMRISFERNVSQ